MTLLGPNGLPIHSEQPTNKKAAPPKLGTAFGAWAGRDLDTITLPGGGVIQFDLSKLTTADFRAMRDHYQVQASLSVLTFLQHQSDWHIECEDKKIAEHVETNLKEIWTGLNRSLGTANWAGFSPSALEWENEANRINLSKVKDLVPEECAVNWKEVEGWAPPGRTPPKFKTYDGIRQIGSGWPIPTENTLWFPILMEQGDYYGRKLLRPAFTSWYFSILLHLFANRYYERFGEPVPVGRAPFDEDIDIEGKTVRGNTYLLGVLQDLRNRSVVVLPNDRTPNETGQGSTFDYDIEYLESQMRGADFERYMTRLDEEISIGLFTPILLLRTADVGSYNLGQGHQQVYQWMLNAMNDDRKVYIDKYIIRKMVDYNFGKKAPNARIVFRKLGNTDIVMIKELLVSLVNADKVMPDVDELGEIAGMTLKQVRETTAPDPNAPDDPAASAAPSDPANVTFPGVLASTDYEEMPDMTEVRATAKEVVDRVRQQVENAFRAETFGEGLQINMGYKRKMERSLAAHGAPSPVDLANRVYNNMDKWLCDVVAYGPDEFTCDSFLSLFEQVLDNEITQATSSVALSH